MYLTAYWGGNFAQQEQVASEMEIIYFRYVFRKFDTNGRKHMRWWTTFVPVEICDYCTESWHLFDMVRFEINPSAQCLVQTELMVDVQTKTQEKAFSFVNSTKAHVIANLTSSPHFQLIVNSGLLQLKLQKKEGPFQIVGIISF